LAVVARSEQQMPPPKAPSTPQEFARKLKRLDGQHRVKRTMTVLDPKNDLIIHGELNSSATGFVGPRETLVKAPGLFRALIRRWGR
jgi:hypothetical protein